MLTVCTQDPLASLPAEEDVAARLLEVRREQKRLQSLLRLLLALRDDRRPRRAHDGPSKPRAG